VLKDLSETLLQILAEGVPLLVNPAQVPISVILVSKPKAPPSMVFVQAVLHSVPAVKVLMSAHHASKDLSCLNQGV